MSAPQYRIYLSEGRQIDIDAAKHRDIFGQKSDLVRVDFLNANSQTVASFCAAALHGYTKTDNLINQQDKVPRV